MKGWLLALTALLAAQAVVAGSAPPRVGLVLSGGGARGSAHIGVLKVLDELKVPVHAIAGTSMGAVVGGLYASGMSGAEIEALFSSVDWQDAFRDRPARTSLAYRRKQEDRDFLVNLPLGLRGKRLLIPKGLVQGQKLTQILRGATAGVAMVRDFDQLAVPFRAVATNLETGEVEVLGSGDLVTAMRASLSAPGVFTPVERDGKLLVDGGLVKNLPIDVARGMGVNVLIVVDASPPLDERDVLESLAEVSNQAITILVRRDVEAQLATLRPTDVLLVPPMPDVSSYDFQRLAPAVAAGEQAARDVRPALQRLALADIEYARWLAARRAMRQAMPVVQFVRTESDSQRYETLIAERFGNLVGRSVDAGEIEETVTELYGQGNFELLDYQLAPATEGFGLQFSARRNSWGPNYVRLGLSLQDDFSGNSEFNAAGRLLFTELNSFSGELAIDLQAGSEPRLGAEFFQPLSLRQRYFIAPRALIRAYNVPQNAGLRQIGEFRVRSREFGLDGGVEIGNWGEFRIGALSTHGRTRIRLGDPTIPDQFFGIRAGFLRFRVDTLDRANFPRSGQALSLELRFEDDNGGGQGSDLLSFDWRGAWSRDKNTAVLWLSAGQTVGGSTVNQRTYFPVGGFLNLSGVRAGSLAGPNFAVLRAIYLRKVGEGGEGVLNVPAYAGISLESGNAWQQRSEMSFGNSRFNASLFFGADTYIGPVYLAAGYDDARETALYLFLGRSF